MARFGAEHLGAFFDQEVNPGAAERDETRTVIPRSTFTRAAEIGLLNYLLPSDVGGLDGSRRLFGLLLEQVGYYSEDPSYGTMLAMFADVPNVIYRAHGPAAPILTDRYVRPMARGELLGTFAYTDYGDAFAFQARCRQDGDGFVLHGVKCLQTGGELADLFVVYVRDEQNGMKVFLLERDQPGLSLTPVTTMGHRSAGLTQLHMDDVRVPASHLLSTQDGLADAQVFLNSRRIYVVCPLVGVMQRTTELCTSHLGTVIREGRPLTQAQTVQARLGNMSARCQCAQAILHAALDRIDRGEVNDVFDPFISSAKFMLTEHAVEVCERAIRLTGWRGYSDELPFGRFYRAAMGALTGQTAQDVLEIQLGVIAIAQQELSLHVKGTT
ncbi:MAG: acyl-CoA dehydrogenase family protein [Haliangiales bacterium]